MPILTTGAGKFPAIGGGGSSTTWDPAHTSANLTLTNGNLTATGNTSGGNPGTYTTGSGASTGKFYYEAHADNFAALLFFGISNGSNPNFPPGVFASDGVSLRSDGNVYYQAFTVLGTAPTFVVGDTVGIAIDLTNTLIWFRNNNAPTVWNAGGGAAPDVSGGYNFSGAGLAGPYRPQCNTGGGSADGFTANFGGTAFNQSAPAGYGNF